MARMTPRITFSTLIISSLVALAGCGPTCPEAKASLDQDTLTSEDVARVNAFVEKRKSAMAEAETAEETLRLNRLKFSVTAYEQAIETQARIIKISPSFEDEDAYDENKDLILEFRCFMDEVAQDIDYTISDGVGKEIQRYHDLFDKLLRKSGELAKSELREYIEEGIGGE